MDILQFDHNVSTGVTNVFASPPVAAAFAAGVVVGGVAGLAGALKFRSLADIVLGDPTQMAEKLMSWLSRIKAILDAVVDRAKDHLRRQQENAVWASGFGSVPEPQDMMQEYHSVWQIVIKLQNRTQVAIRLNFWDRRDRMKALQAEFQRARVLCETLDCRIMAYSDTVNEVVCSSADCSKIAERILAGGSDVD